MSQQICKCGHSIHWHDLDRENHYSCIKCNCTNFEDLEEQRDMSEFETHEERIDPLENDHLV